MREDGGKLDAAAVDQVDGALVRVRIDDRADDCQLLLVDILEAERMRRAGFRDAEEQDSRAALGGGEGLRGGDGVADALDRAYGR